MADRKVGIIMRKTFLVVVAFGLFLTACDESPHSITESSPVVTPPIAAIPDIDDNSENADSANDASPSSDTYDNNHEESADLREIFVDSKDGLGKILGVDFTNTNLTEIWGEANPNGTEVFFFYTGSYTSLLLEGFRGFHDVTWELEYFTEGEIAFVERMGLCVTNIQSYWEKQHDFNDGTLRFSREMRAYVLNEPHADDSNIFIYAGLGAKVSLDVEKILAE
jgi:hypothetical protein